MKYIDISVVIPVYSNADTLPELSQRVEATLKPLVNSHEIIFINDASTDNSAEVLEQLAHNNDSIKAVHLEKNIGQQEATRQGIKISKGDAIVVMDADLQDPPEAISEMFRHMKNHQLDAVFVARHGDYQGKLRMISSRAFKRIVSLLSGLPNNVGSYVIFSRRVADNIIARDTHRFYMSGLVGLSGYPLSTLVIERNFRQSGQSSYNLPRRLKVAIHYVLCLLEARMQCPKNQ